MMPFEWDVRVSSKDHTVTAPTSKTRPAATAGYTTLRGTTMLGHASAAMTLDTYADLLDDDLDNVAAALNRARESQIASHAPQL